MPIRSSCAFLAAGVALACLIQPASAGAKRQVGTCTNNALQYPTIQAAVNASAPGDKVQICPGNYAEQVSVSKVLTLENVAGKPFPTIVAPGGGFVLNATTLYGQAAAAQILVASPGGAVNIENVVVDGTGFTPPDGGCQDEFFGIYYQNAGGTISGNTTKNQLLPPDGLGCQDGEGIFVETQATGTPALKIAGNMVSDFDKNGITVSYSGANATIQNNVVTGAGSIDWIAQNGIQVGYGATGSISGNTVSELIYSPETYGASAILLYNSQAGTYTSAPKISNNTITDSQYGIVLDAVNGISNKLIQIKQNGISNAAFAGIGLYSDNAYSPPLSDDYIKVQNNTISGTAPLDAIDVCSDHNQIKGNTVSSSGEAGIHLDGECTEADGSTSGVGNSVASNIIEDNCVGILSGSDPGTNSISKSNTFTGNTVSFVYNSDSYSCGAGHRSGLKARSGSAKQMPAIQPR